jgi:hypothetical protein
MHVSLANRDYCLGYEYFNNESFVIKICDMVSLKKDKMQSTSLTMIYANEVELRDEGVDRQVIILFHGHWSSRQRSVVRTTIHCLSPLHKRVQP